MRLRNLFLLAIVFVSAIAVGQHASPSGAPAAGGAEKAPTPSPASGAGEHTNAPVITETHSSSPQTSPISGHSGSEPRSVKFDSPAIDRDKRVPEHGAGEYAHDADREFKKATSPEMERAPEKPTELKAKAPEKHPKPCKAQPCQPCLRDLTKGTCMPQAATTMIGCQPGELWNGVACVPLAANQCQAGTIWDGTACVSKLDDCAALTGHAHLLIQEAQRLRLEKDQACSQDRLSIECAHLTARYESAVWRYRVLYEQASPRCQSRLLNPDLL